MRRSAINRSTNLSHLPTEQTNTAAHDLDLKSSLEIARVINAEDAKVASAVKAALPQIAQGIDLIAKSIKQGGRLIYVGAGTSGRLAALDASECPPTFNTDPRTVQFVIAGGTKALHSATEASEDSRQLGQREMAKRKPGKTRRSRWHRRQRTHTLHRCRRRIRPPSRCQNHRGHLQRGLCSGKSRSTWPSSPRSARKLSPDRAA